MRTRRGAALATLLALLAAHAVGAEEAALERARKIVAGSCFLCHGMRGETGSETSPRLAGQNAAYLVKQLNNFKSGERRSTVMQPMVANLGAEDIRALALYFSRQKSERQPTADSKLAAQGMLIYHRGGAATEVAACVGCHGERGEGTESLPRLAGQVAAYIAAQLKNFGSRERTNDNAVMHTIAAKMTDAEIAAVAEYLSGLE
ncbi:MAG: c-type cytochrome [Burkholderiales bacterium]|nr:c-type cytochrome [Burkholderiales bacterium]